MKHHAVILTAIACLIAGCDSTLSGGTQLTDSEPVLDQGASDLLAESPLADTLSADDGGSDSLVDTGFVEDTTVDAGITPDSTVDAGITPDSTVDAGITPDSTVDAGITPDSTVDAGITPDSTVDAGITPDSSVDSGSPPPVTWSPSLNVGDRFTINGNEYEAESAFETWSINLATNTTSDLTRFEVRSGDYWLEGGTSSERAELDGWPFAWSYTAERWMAFSLLIEPGQPFNPDWCTIVQTHGGSSGLPFHLLFEDDNLIVATRNDVSTDQHYNQPLSRDEWHNFVIHFKAGPSGNGLLEVWLDGAQITDYTGAIGYTAGTSIYWKFGIYRGYADIPQTLAIQYANMEVTAADLSARIANPLPIPTTF